MNLVGSQRSGAKALADHLMNDHDNDHVSLIEIDGFLADTLHGAMDEADAISSATQCKKFLFSVSLNPPEGVVVTEEGFKEAADCVAERLGLSDQPRAVVIHEKKGRRHAHAVWSRIDSQELKAIEIGLYKLKLRDLSRELFLDHGWELPNGLKTYGKKNPLNFTLAEWQQAQRIGVDPREMKQLFLEAWTQSDDLKSLTNALEDRGLYLAKGDRRGFVALDFEGNPYSLSRWTGIKPKDLKERLGDPEGLPSVQRVIDDLKAKKTDQVRQYISEVKQRHDREMRPYYEERAQMVTAQRAGRAMLKEKQEERWIKETKERSDRLNTGLRGLFDRFTGAQRKTKEHNAREALACAHRDQEQRDRLILAQLAESGDLQKRAGASRKKHQQERKQMAKLVTGYLRSPQVPTRRNPRSKGLDISR